VKQPWWKRFLSNFTTFSIEKVDSQYSKTLEIIYSQGRYSLCTENAMYSYEDLYLNFRESFQQIELDKFNIKNVLLLGVGLCSVPIILEKIFQKKYSYCAVDIDPEIIRLAKKYGLPLLSSPIEMCCADAFEFVKKETVRYDLVIVDLFIDDVVPSEFERNEFLVNLKNLLHENGLLMYNRMALSDEALKKTEDFFKHQFQTTFPKANFLTIGGNKMLLSRR